MLTSLVTVATLLFDELHVADDSTCVLLSLNVPVAPICWLTPAVTEGLAGVSAIDTKPGGVKVAGWYTLDPIRLISVSQRLPDIQLW